MVRVRFIVKELKFDEMKKNNCCSLVRWQFGIVVYG